MRFLVLGANGMAGHVISLYLSERRHDVSVLARRQGILDLPYIIGDVKNHSFIEGVLCAGEYDAVINCVGILNQMAENDKENAIYINALFPHILSKITKRLKTRCVHLSTDCVFSGKEGDYTEVSIPNGMGVYSRSKILGELNDDKNLTFRTSIVGPEINNNGIGLMHWFMQQTDNVDGYEMAFWTGVTTLTLAKAIEQGVIQNITGLYHLVNNKKISKYDLLCLFNNLLRKNRLEIHKSKKVQHDKSLKCTRKDFCFSVPDYKVMVKEIQSWIVAHKELYPNYEVISDEEAEGYGDSWNKT